MRRRRIRVHRMRDERDAARPEARVLVGAGNLLGELRRESAVHGRGVTAGLLEHAAGHHRHDATASVAAGMIRAGPRLAHEAADLLLLATGKPFGFVLERLEARAEEIAQFLEPGAGALLSYFKRRV